MMLLEAILDDGQHALVDESADRVLHRAFVFREETAYVVQIEGVQHPGMIPLVRDAELPVEVPQQPQRADEQELDVLHEGGSLAFDGVADELPDPTHDEDHEACEPKRP